MIPCLMCALLLLLTAGNAVAQTSLQIPLQFDFINPGAKSLALGGAYVGLADDATAAFANPAGLTQLGVSEVSVELRASRGTTPFLERGRLSGPLLNIGIDTVQGPVFANSVGTDIGAGFIAGVYVRPSHRWVVAGYRHDLVRIDQSFLSQGVFQRAPDRFSDERDRPQEAIRKIAITSYGASGSYKLSRTVAVGGSLTLYDFHIDSTFRRFPALGGFTGPADLQNETSRATQKGDDVALAPTVGVLVGDGPWHLGLNYRRGASFTYTTVDGDLPPVEPRFRVPHTLAAGASYRVRQLLTLTGEVTYVTYSRLRDDFVTDQANRTNRADSFHIRSGTEIHGGIQYALPALKGRPRLRAGMWRDPDHTIKFTPLVGGGSADRIFDERFLVALSNGGTRLHGTAGVGLTFSPHAEWNTGIDVASQQFRFSTSFIIR
ncbi:MAG: hypothetical protein ABMA15_08990 [Vicinamibacterales bacterium]